MEESSVEIPPYITEAYLLFTQEVLDRIVSEIPLLEVAPDYMFRSSLINEGMVYKGDPFYLLHVFYDKIVTQMQLEDEQTAWLAQYADLITRSQFKQQWYIQQISKAKELVKSVSQIIDFQALANLAFFCKNIQEQYLQEEAINAMSQFLKRSQEQYIEYLRKLEIINKLQQQTIVQPTPPILE